MRSDKWIEQAKRDADKLRQLIGKYHPKRKPPLTKQQRDLVGEDMTAPNAELACENIRDDIRQQFDQLKLPDPIQIFDQALKKGDAVIAFNILSQTWFGVPETTACWSFTGFSEAVDLLDDPPEQVGDGGDLSNGDVERDLGSHGRKT